MRSTPDPGRTGRAIIERWRAVPGYDAYEVSDLGRVRRGPRVLRDQPHNGGYRHVQLWTDGKPRTGLLHVLVARAFIGPTPADHDVNHIDGDKSNNTLSNLEYATRSENNRHAYRIGLRRPSQAAAAAARRKPRQIVPCACGCGRKLETPDVKGRARSFINGHNGRKATEVAPW